MLSGRPILRVAAALAAGIALASSWLLIAPESNRTVPGAGSKSAETTPTEQAKPVQVSAASAERARLRQVSPPADPDERSRPASTSQTAALPLDQPTDQRLPEVSVSPFPADSGALAQSVPDRSSVTTAFEPAVVPPDQVVPQISGATATAEVGPTALDQFVPQAPGTRTTAEVAPTALDQVVPEL